MVHVVMYWYYFQSARGVRIWWKEWITRLQIAQFIIDLGKTFPDSSVRVGADRRPGFVYFASYTYFTAKYFPYLPNMGNCAGEEFAAFAGMAILSSYLLLFISFYLATYKKSGQKGRKRSNTAKKAAIDMKNLEVPTVDKTVDAITHSNGALKGGPNASASGRSLSNGPVTRSRKA